MGYGAASSASGFSQGNAHPALVPEPLAQARGRGAHDGEPLLAVAALTGVELQLLYLGVLKPGLSLPGRVQAVRWGGGGPAQAERAEVG